MTTPRKLTIAAVVLLVCAGIVALGVLRAPVGMSVSLRGVETNDQGLVWANISVSNPHPYALHVDMLDGGKWRTGDMISAYSNEPFAVILPAQQPRHVAVEGSRVYTPRLWDVIPRLFDRRDTVTIDIP